MATGSTIRADVQEEVGINRRGLDVDGAAEAFMKRWQDAPNKEPSKAADEGGPQEESETAPPEASDGVEPQDHDGQDQESHDDAPTEGDQDRDDDKPKAEKIADDDAYVTIKVDGEERRVLVKDLKRVYGQEASLTRKSQELASQRKALEESVSRYDTALQELIQRAEARYKPYQELDFFVLSKTLSAEDLAQLRKDAAEAEGEVRFLKERLEARRQEAAFERQKLLLQQARETVKQITDEKSPFHIPGWSDDLYNDLRSFAVQNGVAQEDIDQEVNPAAIKLLWMARQYAKAQDEAKKVKPKAVPTTAKRVASPGSAPSDASASVDVKKALNRLRQTGSVDDAAEAFLARWKARA